jgi:hypothetical protein
MFLLPPIEIQQIVQVLQYGSDNCFVILTPGKRHELAAGVSHNLVNLNSDPSTYLLV